MAVPDCAFATGSIASSVTLQRVIVRRVGVTVRGEDITTGLKLPRAPLGGLDQVADLVEDARAQLRHPLVQFARARPRDLSVPKVPRTTRLPIPMHIHITRVSLL